MDGLALLNGRPPNNPNGITVNLRGFQDDPPVMGNDLLSWWCKASLPAGPSQAREWKDAEVQNTNTTWPRMSAWRTRGLMDGTCLCSTSASDASILMAATSVPTQSCPARTALEIQMPPQPRRGFRSGTSGPSALGLARNERGWGS